MRVGQVLGLGILIGVCSMVGSPSWANGGEADGAVCEVYPTRMDPKLGEWAFVTVCEAESLGPPPVLRIGTRDLPLEPVNTVQEGPKLAVLWVVQDVVDDPASTLQLVFPGSGQTVEVARFDEQAILGKRYVQVRIPGEVGVRLKRGVLEFPLGQRKKPPVPVDKVRINDSAFATWLRRLGVDKIRKTLSDQAESQEDPVSRGYSLRFNERVCVSAIIEILRQVQVIESAWPHGIIHIGEVRSPFPRSSPEEDGPGQRADCLADQEYLHCLDHTAATWAYGVWEYAKGFGQRIVVIDFPIDPSKAPDIELKTIGNPAWDPYEPCDGANPADHGEVMAVIAAGDGRGGWWGVAPEAQLAHIRICPKEGMDALVADLARYADSVLEFNDIVLMAWSMEYNEQVQWEIEKIRGKGAWIFAPDEKLDPPHAVGEYPAAYPEVYGVSGADRDGYQNSGTGELLDTDCMAAHWAVPLSVRMSTCYNLTDGRQDTTASRATAVMAGAAALIASNESHAGNLYAMLDAHCYLVDESAPWGCISAAAEAGPVDVVAFLARRTEAGPVAVAWTTEVEHTQGHFLLSRSGSSPTGPWTPIDSTTTLGDLHTGASYEIVDGAAPAGDLWYRLEQVDGVTGARFQACPPCEARPVGWRDRRGDGQASSDSTHVRRAHGRSMSTGG